MLGKVKCFALASLALSCALSGSAQEGIELGGYPTGRKPVTESIATRSQYLKMDDGVRLAIDFLLPKNLPAERKLPTIIRWARDGHAAPGSVATPLDSFFLEHGYARVLVDERGTGASFGVRNYGKRNLEDMNFVVNWIVQQPWSNGKVGAVGDSFDGRAAEQLAATRNPAVKAVAPRFSAYDDLAENVMPGGIFAEWLVNTRSNIARKRDDVKIIKPVDDDRNGSLLKQAVHDHQSNPDFARLMAKATFRDELIPELGIPAGAISAVAEKDEIERSGVAFYVQAGWLDGASAAGALRRFHDLQNSQRVVIGPWNHLGVPTSILPSREDDPPLSTIQQWSELLAFFYRHLRDETTRPAKQLLYYTEGEDKWKVANQWPPEGAVSLRLHLSPDFKLANASAPGSVVYAFSPDTTTGFANRWHTQVTPAAVRYPSLEAGRLTFTSAPLNETTELTGTSSVTLRIKASEADVAVFAYMEILPLFGAPVYVTEGQLRALHRKGTGFLRKDSAPLTPGEWTDLSFQLLPHSVLVEKGARLRLSLSSFDKDTFARTTPNANWTVDCGASFLELATVRQDNSPPQVRVAKDDPDPLGLRKWQGHYPQSNGYLEIVPEFDHLRVFQVGQEALELTAKVKPADRSKVAERNRIAKEIADGLAMEDIGPLTRSVTVLLKPMTGSLTGEWRSMGRTVGSISAVEVMGTVDYMEKDWATSFLLVRGKRGFRIFTLRWSGMKVGGWGQNEGIPGIRDYYPASDGSFVSAAQGKLPAARIRKRGDTVELVR